MNTFGVKALAFTLLMLVAATVSHAREFSLEDNEEAAVTMVENLAPGFGYSQLRYMYDRKDFSPSQDDRYGLLGTGFASLVIPGLNLYPSVNVMPTSSGIRPVPGLTLAFRF